MRCSPIAYGDLNRISCYVFDGVQPMRNFQLPGRSPVYAANGMAATSHPLATVTAIQILDQGGNAMDAAVAACAVQAVVEPQSTGIGGDCFVLYAPHGRESVISYNGSGRAPRAASAEWYREKNIDMLEPHSPHAVTIPGAVDAWVRMTEDHGTKGLDTLLQPAIGFARDGYPVHPRVAFDWARHADTLSKDATTASIFLPHGKVPNSGDMHAQQLLADTLIRIAAQGRDGFYKGAVARDLVSYLRSMGGFHSMEDFENAQGEYVEPISTHYRGFEVVECPPNGQGLTALMILNILAEMGVPEGDPLSADRLHLEIEAARLAYQERNRYVADPAMADVPVMELLSREHTQRLCAAIDRKKAMPTLPQIDLPSHGDTVYLCVVDRDNNAVSMINSIYTAFGSGLTGPGSGVLLQNRGMSFCLDPEHVNCIAPQKKTRAHHYSRDAEKRQKSSHALRCHGRAVPAHGPCTSFEQHSGLWPGCTGGNRPGTGISKPGRRGGNGRRDNGPCPAGTRRPWSSPGPA